MNIEGFDGELLIREVRQRRVIWDHTCVDYKNLLAKKSAWLGVCHSYCDNYDELSRVAGEELCRTLRTKWKNIRDYYVKEKKDRSGPYKRRSYVFHQQLTFLDEILDLARSETAGVFTKSEDGSGYHYSSSHQLELPSAPESSHRPPHDRESPPVHKRSRLDDHESASGSSEAATYHGLRGSGQIDEDEAFLVSILPALKKFDDYEKLEFRSEVLSLIKRLKFSQPKSAPAYPCMTPTTSRTLSPLSDDYQEDLVNVVIKGEVNFSD